MTRRPGTPTSPPDRRVLPRPSTRVRACWANPAGRDLTDMQNAFYCAVPLELRLCNSPIILHNDLKTATAGDQNETVTLSNGWKQCQGSTETLFPGRFAWTAEINDLYLNLFLRQSSGPRGSRPRKRPASSARTNPEAQASFRPFSSRRSRC